jgi:hypothetical protein
MFKEPLFTKTNPQDIVSLASMHVNVCRLISVKVLFVGSPGAGKSTFYEKILKSLGYIRINQDTLKTRDKCLKVAAEHLSEGKSVAIGSHP